MRFGAVGLPRACRNNPSVILKNDGPVPLAYIARPVWNEFPPNIPGLPSGGGAQLVGVLDPGAQVDISSTFTATPQTGTE